MYFVEKCFMSVFASVFLSLFFVIGVFGSAQAALSQEQANGLVPHKAFYSVEMTSKKSGAQIAYVHGDMVYEWQPSCDAWITNHKFNLNYEFYEAPGMAVTSDFSSYESFDGKTLNFTSQRKNGKNIIEELRGVANRDDSVETSQAVYSIPGDLTFDLPGGTFFPMAHTLDVIKNIREGKKFFKATLFDGSDDKGPVEVSVVVGKKQDMVQYVENFPDIKSDLLQAQAWKLRLAFFSLQEDDGAPDYEMSVVFHENGMISDMVIDYDSFSVRQKLVALERLVGICESGQSIKK